MKTNYQLILDRELAALPGDSVPTLLLHSCCGPCSSYVLEYLSRYFKITVLFYNPNIYPESEFRKRADEQCRLIHEMPTVNPVDLILPEYDPAPFYTTVQGLEQAPEGGDRCLRCFQLRLEYTAKVACAGGYDYFTTTLSVSPHKDAQALNALGGEIGRQYGIRYLYSDFKKRDGYKRSIQLSAEYSLYRQNYCGCAFSLRAAELPVTGEKSL
jgi:predicted adenine nucleotide alpha hydrolase (AANH) superfamily ATPase